MTSQPSESALRTLRRALTKVGFRSTDNNWWNGGVKTVRNRLVTCQVIMTSQGFTLLFTTAAGMADSTVLKQLSVEFADNEDVTIEKGYTVTIPLG